MTEAEIHFTGYGENEESILLIVMNEKENYHILLDGKTAEVNERTNGCLEIRFHSKKGERHHLTVAPVR